MQWNSRTAARHSPGALAYVVTRIFSETSLGMQSLRRFQQSGGRVRILVDPNYFIEMTNLKQGSPKLALRRAQDMAASQAWTWAEAKVSSTRLASYCLLVDRNFFFGSSDPMAYDEHMLSQERGYHRAARVCLTPAESEQEYSRLGALWDVGICWRGLGYEERMAIRQALHD